MQIRNDYSNQSVKPSFGTIHLGSGAETALRKILKPSDWVEFEKIAQKQKCNSFVDITLFGDENGKLSANVYRKNSLCTDPTKIYEQHFWNSSMGFIKKVAAAADKWAQKIRKEPQVNVDEIIANLDSKINI